MAVAPSAAVVTVATAVVFAIAFLIAPKNLMPLISRKQSEEVHVPLLPLTFFYSYLVLEGWEGLGWDKGWKGGRYIR